LIDKLKQYLTAFIEMVFWAFSTKIISNITNLAADLGFCKEGDATPSITTKMLLSA